MEIIGERKPVEHVEVYLGEFFDPRRSDFLLAKRFDATVNLFREYACTRKVWITLDMCTSMNWIRYRCSAYWYAIFLATYAQTHRMMSIVDVFAAAHHFSWHSFSPQQKQKEFCDQVPGHFVLSQILTWINYKRNAFTSVYLLRSLTLPDRPAVH